MTFNPNSHCQGHKHIIYRQTKRYISIWLFYSTNKIPNHIIKIKIIKKKKALLLKTWLKFIFKKIYIYIIKIFHFQFQYCIFTEVQAKKAKMILMSSIAIVGLKNVTIILYDRQWLMVLIKVAMFYMVLEFF